MSEPMVLIVIVSDDHKKVLICKHRKQGMYNFVGGHIEAGEEAHDAAV